MNRILSSFFTFAFGLISLAAYADQAGASLSLRNHAFLYVDEKGGAELNLSSGFNSLLQNYDFEPLSGSLNRGYQLHPHWLMADIPEVARKGDWWIEYDYPLMDSVKVYVAKGDQGWQPIAETGDIEPFHTRQYFSPRFYFRIPEGSTHVLLRLQTLGAMHLPLSVLSDEFLEARSNSEQFLYGLFFGALAIMMFYNLFIYAMSLDRAHLYYVGFIASITIFMLAVTGYGSLYLWSSHSYWVNQNIQPFSVGLCLLFVVIFSRRVLDIRSFHQRLDRVLQGLGWLSLVLVLGGLVLPYRIMAQATAIWPIIVVVTIVYSGAYSFRKKTQGASLFLLAWGAGLLGALLFSSQMQGWIPNNLVTQNALKLGIILNVTLLSFSLVTNIQKLRQEKASLEKEAKENYQLALVDALTGVPNRRAFDERLAVELERCRRDKTNIALLMIDVDFFKNFNDAYGHQLGDDTLIRVALIMRNCLRRPTDMLFRYGGEEFSVILADTDIEGATNTANRIMEAIRGLCIPHKESPFKQVTVSIGLAVAENAKIESEEFIQFADEALYKAKGQGRNQVVCAECEHSAVVNIGNYFKNSPKDTL